MRHLSEDNMCTVVKFGDDMDPWEKSTNYMYEQCQPGQYLACLYDNEWYMGYTLLTALMKKRMFVSNS